MCVSWTSKGLNVNLLFGTGEVEVGIVTRLRAGLSGVRILVGARYFLFLQNVQTGSGARLASHSMVKVAGA